MGGFQIKQVSMLAYFNSTEAGPSSLGHPVNNFYSFDSRFTKH